MRESICALCLVLAGCVPDDLDKQDPNMEMERALRLFPAPAVAAYQLRLAQSHVARVEETMAFDPGWGREGLPWLWEARRRRDAWDSLVEAQRTGFAWRRTQEMEKLRDMLPPGWFAAGRMPAPIPEGK